MKKYLLSTGKVTDKIEYYILDLFRLYLSIYPRDIPGADRIGFDFNLTDTFKANLSEEVESRVSGLISKIRDRFQSGISINLESCELIDERLAKIIVSVGEIRGEEIVIDIYDNSKI